MALCRPVASVDFSIAGVPCHVLITTPTLQHTHFGLMETVVQGQMPLLVKSGLVSGTGLTSFGGRHFRVSAALNAVAVREKWQFPYQRSCATTPQQAKGSSLCLGLCSRSNALPSALVCTAAALGKVTQSRWLPSSVCCSKSWLEICSYVKISLRCDVASDHFVLLTPL